MPGKAPSDVHEWQEVADEACVEPHIAGTTFLPADDGYRIRTFRGPEWSGCTDLSLERLVVRSSSGRIRQQT